jgi:iron complex outermembrane recepter protein
VAITLLGVLGLPVAVAAQAAVGTVVGHVTTETGQPLGAVEVSVVGTSIGALTRPGGEYMLRNVPAGPQTIRVVLLGYRSGEATVRVPPGGTVTQDFQLAMDPLKLDAVVATGTQAPRVQLDVPVTVTIVSSSEIEQARPRSTTEMLRYVPGFTRVESSGGEVNQNISMRGILGVEYVMFMEDGLPVFPTMHTFFMNADNLFRPDENINRMEVVRGGTSALFGSNTPGAIINFINHPGGPHLQGTAKATAATGGLGRYDMNLNGPLGEDWRFNVGGFYRYDHGIRNPGFPGVRGGQFKGSITRLLENGRVRASMKVIDDRNQFILPLPFRNPGDPEYVAGFSNRGAMSTAEGVRIRVPTPGGELELPLDDGLRTDAYWLTTDAQFEFEGGWLVSNTAQVMRNDQAWNAILPFDVKPAADWVAELNLPAGSTYELLFVNHRDAAGAPLAFNTANGLVAPGGQWHVQKPLTAFQNQFQLRKLLGLHTVSGGVYFAHYTQGNRWHFTDILMDVRDNPRFLDLRVTTDGETTEYTKHGFRNFLSNYVNGSGQTTVISGTLGGSFQLMDRLRMDAGVRVETNSFVQTTENTSPVDMDGDPSTPYDNVMWGDGTFRHFSKDMTDWAGSLGLNYSLTDQISLYGLAARAFKMPALDEFLFAAAEEQIELFDAREVRSAESGVKFASPTLGVTVNGFYAILKNIISQGAVVDPNTGATTWTVETAPENRSYGVEVEVASAPIPALRVIGSGTLLKAELGSGAGADIGSWINGVPSRIGNLSATYMIDRLTLLADVRHVGNRFSDVANQVKLGAYTYANFGASYALPAHGVTVSADVLNAFESTGFEEGNPRLLAGTTSDVFLARPLLPRRFSLSVRYDF